MSIPQTILMQLGGQHFVVMTGAKQLVSIEEGKGLQLDFMKNPSNANRLRIIYDYGTDTYNVQFIRKGVQTNVYTQLNKVADKLQKKYNCTFGELKEHHEDEFNEEHDKVMAKAKAKAEPTIIKECEGVYCDDLRRIFENTTKLRTSLTHIYGD